MKQQTRSKGKTKGKTNTKTKSKAKINTFRKCKTQAFAQKFQGLKKKKSTRLSSTASKRKSAGKRGKYQRKR